MLAIFIEFFVYLKKMQARNIYKGKREKYYCVELFDISLKRNNRLSEILGDDPPVKLYHSPLGPTHKIHHAKFWKDKTSAQSWQPKSQYFSKLIEFTAEEFIDLIPDPDSTSPQNLQYVNSWFETNLNFKNDQIEYNLKWKEFRKKYKAIDAYIKVKDPDKWLPCNDCGLIPLVWEFNNGRSTACGCGENEYRHHSIQAESIMSYVTRNNGSSLDYNSDELRINWNTWVKKQVNLFELKKSEYENIW